MKQSKQIKLTKMQKDLLHEVGGEDISLSERVKKVEDVMNAGVILDEKLLVVADPDNLRAEIAKDFVETKKQIDEARKRGQHVLYIPGSYDLVHAGHASYALQVTEQYLGQHPELKREDLYVVMLSDDDDLISTVKAYKRKGYSAKGDEEFARPIESAQAFTDIDIPHHSRLVGTASLPVDLVGFIPSPKNMRDYAHELAARQKLDAKMLNIYLDKFIEDRKPSDTDVKELKAAIGSYEKLVHALGNGGYADVASSFEALGKPFAEVDPNAPWSIQSYQLFNHTYLASGEGFNAPFVRIVSVHDDKYKDQVDFLMQVAGVKVESINDVEVVSTTKLLKKFGPDNLREAKRKHYIQ